MEKAGIKHIKNPKAFIHLKRKKTQYFTSRYISILFHNTKNYKSKHSNYFIMKIPNKKEVPLIRY